MTDSNVETIRKEAGEVAAIKYECQLKEKPWKVLLSLQDFFAFKHLSKFKSSSKAIIQL